MLRKEYDHLHPVIRLTGLAGDAAELQRYVELLACSPLLASAQIQSLEAASDGAGWSGSQFELRLDVRPGYGQPGGPQTAPALRQPAMARK